MDRINQVNVETNNVAKSSNYQDGGESMNLEGDLEESTTSNTIKLNSGEILQDTRNPQPQPNSEDDVHEELAAIQGDPWCMGRSSTR